MVSCGGGPAVSSEQQRNWTLAVLAVVLVSAVALTIVTGNTSALRDLSVLVASVLAACGLAAARRED